MTPGIGIIGCGDIARVRYLPEVAGLAAVGAAEFAAVCDADPARAERAAAEHGADAAYDGYEDLLADPAVDVAVDILPQELHGEVNRAIVESGTHLYTEKPIATDLDDADDIVETAERNDVRVAAAPPRILHPTYRYLRAFLEDGGIGEVAFATAMASHEGAGLHKPYYDPGWFYAADAGGALFDMGIYGIQRLVYLLGSAEAVTALSSRKVDERYVGYFDDDDRFHEDAVDATADDNTLLLLDFGAGTFGFVAATHNVKAARGPKDQLFGAAGTACVEYDGGFRPAIYLERDDVRGWIDDPLPLRTDADLAPETVPPGYDKSGFATERAPEWDAGTVGGVEHLVECLAADREPIIDGRLGRHCLEIMLAAQRSAETGERQGLSTTAGDGR